MTSASLLRYGGALTIVLGLAVLISTLAFAPIHGVHSAAECQRAYAKADSRSDTMSVDFLSFPDPAGHAVPHRCGELRPAPFTANRP